MAITGCSTVPQKKSWGLTKVLAFAVFEWILILLLYVDAIFSCLVTRFARYCDLNTPCLLCSRLDHILGNEKPGFYRDLLCTSHKLEISSLVFCHCHSKLVDVQQMCESCVASFANVGNPIAETFKLLVGKLGTEPHKFVSSGEIHCSCCNRPCMSTGYGFVALELDLPLKGSIPHSDLGKETVRSSSSVCAFQRKQQGDDFLSCVGYTELRGTSDTESNISLSDNGEGSALVLAIDDTKDNFQDKYGNLERHNITSTGDLFSWKPIDASSFEPEALLLDSGVQASVIETNVGTLTESDVATYHGLDEHTWQQDKLKTDQTLRVEPICPAPQSCSAAEATIEVLRESNGSENVELAQMYTDETEICRAVNGPTKTGEMTTGTSFQTSQSLELADAYKLAISNGPITMDNSTGASFHRVQNLELLDAYKLAISNSGRQLSGLLSRQWSGTDSTRVNEFEDLKYLLSQLSSSSRVSTTNDDLRAFDVSGSSCLQSQILQKRHTLERNESSFESLDGSIISDIEGESLVDRLKRQVEHDRKSLCSLYKELEEERNASAVAVSQSMAMITRLQEEKAAFQLEALQYLRMVEEQSEYDMETLEKSNSLLAEKEREVHDLEEELSFYRKKFPNGSMFEIIASFPRSSDTDRELLHDNIRGLEPTVATTNVSAVQNPLSAFEDERVYISQCLKKFEEKLKLFSNNGVCLDLPNGEYHGNERDEASDSNKLDCMNFVKSSTEEEYGGGLSVRDVAISSFQSDASNSYGFGELNRENNLVALTNEVSDMNVRLEALEADRIFFDRIMNSLQKGDEGLQFLHEVIHHLRELRRTATSRGPAVA